MKLTERDWLEQMKFAGKLYNETHTAHVVAINSFINYMFHLYGYVNAPQNDVSKEDGE